MLWLFADSSRQSRRTWLGVSIRNLRESHVRIAKSRSNSAGLPGRACSAAYAATRRFQRLRPGKRCTGSHLIRAFALASE